MPIPSSYEMYIACLAVGTAQLLIALRFFLRAKGSPPAPDAGAAVRAAVIVPCKGAPEHLARNAGSILEQDYPAGAEFIFVTPSRADPAWNVLRGVLRAHPGVKAGLLASDAVPERCGEHILNKLYGVAAASPDAEALVFADSDVKVHPTWLLGMTAPLKDPAVGAVTAPLVFLPGGATALCRNLRCAWEAVGIPYLDMTGCVVGASFSILKKNFAAFGVEEMWRKSLSDDLSLTRRLKERGKAVRFAYRSLPVSAEGCDLGTLLGIFNKWMVFFKFYFPLVWAAGALLTAFKLYAVLWSAGGRGWAPAGILFAMDAAHIYAVFRVLKFCRPAEFSGSNFFVISVTAAPLLQLLYAANFISSAFTSRIRWGGYTYRIEGPERITVEP